MELTNLELHRITIHEIFKRNNDRAVVAPVFGAELETLDPEAQDVLRERIVSAMASSPKCMEMAITSFGADSMVAIARDLVDADDELYIERSRQVPRNLANAQTSRGLPGGVVVAFSASAGVPARRLMGVIKAEVHNGFARQMRNGRISLGFLRDLLLTPQTKLYKIGLFMEVSDPLAEPFPQAWRAYVYDELMTANNRDGAAQYFYGTFLGCDFPESSARRTKEFHDLTKKFVRALEVPEEQKLDLYNALVTYLKVDQSPTVAVDAFGMTYFADPELRDAYAQFMDREGFPAEAIPKDLADIESVLKTRRVTFRNNVKITAPAASFDQLLTIRVIDGDEQADGQRPQWTQITVKDRISGQE